MICFSSPAGAQHQLRRLAARNLTPGAVLVRTLLLVFALAVTTHGATAKSSGRPRVYVDASLVKGLVAAPVPNYPLKALEKGWSGLGVFELQFRADGTVKKVVTVLTTEHQLLDETARMALWQWRSKPHAQSTARLTMTFSSHYYPVTIKPEDKEALKNTPVHPNPTYPFEARQHGWTGTGLFVMRFRPDGSMKQVVVLKSTGKQVLDQECVRTFLRWRCLPGVYETAFIPVTFLMGR